jgi:hypothetical protein
MRRAITFTIEPGITERPEIVELLAGRVGRNAQGGAVRSHAMPLICRSGEFTAACGTDQICHPVETVPDYNVAAHGPGRGMFGWVHQSASVARMKN